MFDRLKHVVREKNKLQKERKKRRNKDIADMRDESIFSARLNSDFSVISVILLDSNIDRVEVETSQENLARLDRAMYGHEMAEYNVTKDDNRYIISNKEIYL